MPERSRARRLVAIGLGLGLALSLSTPALAHKLRVFAAADGDLITGSTYFAGGGPAAGAHVSVQDGQGRTLAELTPDPAGRFSYRAQAAVDHVVVAATGDGHRTEWRIPASDIAGAVAARGPDAPDLPDRPAPRPAAPGGPADTQASVIASDGLTEAAVERAVARQVRPLREQLMAAEDQTRLRDILGGIGYIVGLAGLALWWHGRGAGRP